MADYQLTIALCRLFLYSDYESHFKHKIQQKMLRDLVSVQGWPLNTGKNNKDKQNCCRVAVAALIIVLLYLTVLLYIEPKIRDVMFLLLHW